jgi:hypothetical protein
MRAIWEALHASLEQLVLSRDAMDGFHRARRIHPVLGRFETPGELIAYLHGKHGGFDDKDVVIAALVAMAQSEGSRDLGLHLALLGLWPGLDAAFRRRSRRLDAEPAELVSAMFDHFARHARTLDLERVGRVAATLVRNTERDVTADLVAQRIEAAGGKLPEEMSGGDQSPLGLAAGIDAETQLPILRERLSAVEGCDVELVLSVSVLGHTQLEASISLGLSPETGRKRMQRSVARIRSFLESPQDGARKSTRRVSHSGDRKRVSQDGWGDLAVALDRLDDPNPAPRRNAMGQDMWKQTEEMAKQHEQGASSWLKLQNDNDRAVVVFLGEPYPREVCFVEGKYIPFNDDLKAQGVKPTLRIALNVALHDTKEVKVLEQGVTFFKDLIRVRDKYTLEKWAFEVQRHGAAKDPKTTYSILPEKQLSPDEIRTFAALQLHDLSRLYDAVPEDAPAEAPIDPQVALALGTALKSLPREAVDRFCQHFGVQRIKELGASQTEKAKVFVEALVNELGVDAQVDPFA